MKRIRVVNKQNGMSSVLTYAKGVVRMFMYGDKEPHSFKCTEDEFDNYWSNPDTYERGDNEVYVI